MATVTIEEVQAKLPELLARLQPGEELVIVRDDQPVAKLTSQLAKKHRDRVPGSDEGAILYMADDFDAPLDDFKEYME